MKAKLYTIDWQGITIHINYIENYSKAIELIQGYRLAHIEIQANLPLPLTSTGYRSIFLPLPEVKEKGDAVSFVKHALDCAAESAEWKNYLKENEQLTLF